MNTIKPPEADADIVEQMSYVNWREVTEREASSFGLAMGAYRDAYSQHDKHRTLTGSLLMVSCVYTPMVLLWWLVFHVSLPYVASFAVVSWLLYAWKRFRLRLVKELMDANKEALMREIGDMAIRHPMDAQTSPSVEDRVPTVPATPKASKDHRND